MRRFLPQKGKFSITKSLLFLATFSVVLTAAPPSRITQPVDPSRTAAVPGKVNRLAQPSYDQGAVDPAMKLNDMLLMVKPSVAQQADLDQLLFDQQNPSSKNFHQ